MLFLYQKGDAMPTAVVNPTLVRELVNQNVALQKVAVALAEQSKHLTERTDRLLSLFEEAAKNIEKGEMKEPLAKQLEGLLEQNKIIARGLVLLEKYIRDKTSFGLQFDQPKQLPKV
jgi:hypothetical protein